MSPCIETEDHNWFVLTETVGPYLSHPWGSTVAKSPLKVVNSNLSQSILQVLIIMLLPRINKSVECAIVLASTVTCLEQGLNTWLFLELWRIRRCIFVSLMLDSSWMLINCTLWSARIFIMWLILDCTRGHAHNVRAFSLVNFKLLARDSKNSFMKYIAHSILSFPPSFLLLSLIVHSSISSSSSRRTNVSTAQWSHWWFRDC